jgi:hypothetical protein
LKYVTKSLPFVFLATGAFHSFGKCITMEQHQIRTEPQSQPTEDFTDAEVAKKGIICSTTTESKRL